MKTIQKILLGTAGLLFAAAIAVEWHGRRLARLGQATPRAEDVGQLGAEIIQLRERLARAESEQAKLATTRETLRAAPAGTGPARPAVTAIDPKHKAALEALATVPWWDVVWERNPQLQALGRASRRTEFGSTYGAFWRTAGLSSEAIERFKDLIIESEERGRDLGAVARERGLAKNDPAMVAMQAQAQAELVAAQRELLGEANFQALQRYEWSSSVRSMLGTVAGSLAFTDEPLTFEQAEQLTAVIVPLCRTEITGGKKPEPGSVEMDQAMRERRPAREALDVEALRAATRDLLTPTQFALLEAWFAHSTTVTRVFNLLQRSSDEPVTGFWFGRSQP